MREPVDAPAVVAVEDPVLLLEMTRDRRVVLDDFPVVIHDPDRAIRPVQQVHRVTPLIRRRRKLRHLLSRRAPQLQPRPVALDERAMDHIPRRLAREELPVQPRQRVVLIHQRPAHRGEPPIRLALRRAVAALVVLEIGGVIRSLLPPRMRLGNGIRAPVAHRHLQVRRRRVRIAREVMRGQRRDGKARRRRHREPVAALRHRKAERVRRARHRLDGAPIRANAEIRARQRHRLRELRPRDGPAIPAAPEVDPPIRAPLRRIDAALQLTRAEAGEQNLPHVRLARARAVLEKNNVRRARDDDPTARRHKPIHRRQSLRPHHRLVHAPVAVRIRQQLHHAERARLRRLLELRVRLYAAHLRVELAGLVQLLDVELPREIVAVQLAHKHPPMLIPAHARRRRDERLTRDDLHAKPLRQPERRRAFLRRARLRRVIRLGNLRAGEARDEAHREREGFGNHRREDAEVTANQCAKFRALARFSNFTLG